MPIYKKNYLLNHIFYERGLKWRAGCRQTKNRQGAGSANSGACYIPALKPDAASGPAASITQPTASLPLCPRNNERGLLIYA